MNAVARIERDDRGHTGHVAMTLEFPAGTSSHEWLNVARQLRLVEMGVQWKIGDWWRHACANFGQEWAKQAAADVWGVEGETARVYGWVAEQFTPVTRGTALAFSHYKAVASLPSETAQVLLRRAEQESWTKANTEREVKALKAANDPGEPATTPEPRPRPFGQGMALAVHYAGISIRALERLQIERQASGKGLTIGETKALTKARGFYERMLMPIREHEIPADFEIIVREKGREDAEIHYQMGRIKFDQIMTLLGEPRLVDDRAKFVGYQRSQDKPKPAPVPVSSFADYTTDRATLQLACRARDYLQNSKNGGWSCYQLPSVPGMWKRGSATETSEELIAYAERKGFDRRAANLQIAAEEGVAVGV